MITAATQVAGRAKTPAPTQVSHDSYRPGSEADVQRCQDHWQAIAIKKPDPGDQDDWIERWPIGGQAPVDLQAVALNQRSRKLEISVGVIEAVKLVANHQDAGSHPCQHDQNEDGPGRDHATARMIRTICW